MMTSLDGRLVVIHHGRVIDLRCVVTFTDSDLYAALIARGVRPIEAEAMAHRLITITKHAQRSP